MKAKKIIIAVTPLLIFLVLVLVFKSSLSNDPRKLETKLVGQKVPSFKLGSVTNPEQVITDADLPKEIYLLNVWGTWCVSCYAEHPYLMEFSKTYPIKWVGMNYKDQPKDAIDYLQKYGDPFIYSIADISGQLGIDLGVYGAPETFIVDAEGYIRDRHVGVIDNRVWNKVIVPKLEAIGWENKL
ncbi:DsbE family thiol:disulfide interchange protein [Kangiella sp. HZ709]|uniref:DsbE family thiol:disulfide interchange protein n=1 Tax=Kangiella sp. HZ709 TaxID=2666328 RepID=UPI0012B075A4|nr:DsbE family thiol:disulfide interchange protein [Kangiella sp. HZ709]MRX26567.1 DsbE family thiol:disulfide interchange protein [Kangiella sp. HZ709]